MDNNIRISTSSDLSGVNSVRSGLIEIRNLAQEIGKQGIQMPTSAGQSYQGPIQTASARMREFHNQATSSMPGYSVIGQSNQTPSFGQPNNPNQRRQPINQMTPMQAFQNSFQRRQTNSNWSAQGLASTAGTVLGTVTSPLAVGALIAGGIVSSFNKYMQSGDSLSGLTKQILTTKDSLESLQKSVLGAGATMAMNADMTAKVANSLGTAYGSMSLSTLTSRVSQVGGMGLAYGVSPDALAQGFAGAARLGITTGPGSTMGQGQLAFGLANSAAQSGMSGRMEELMQEMLSVTQSIQATSVTSNPSTLLGIITAMNGNLPRSMQGAGGASILGQISSSVANPNGLQQIMNYKAMSTSGVKSYFGMMRDQQMGPGFVLPNGQTNVEAIFGQYNKMFGKNPDQESYFLQQGLGISMPQADEMMKVFGPGGKGMSSIKDNLGINPNQLKDTDWSKLALLGKLGSANSESDLQSVIGEWGANGGILSDEQKKALEGGTTDQKKKILAQDILGGKYSPKTTTEQINTLTATVTNAQITVTGSLASGTVKGATGSGNAIDDFTKKHFNSGASEMDEWNKIKGTFSNILSFMGIGVKAQTSYNPQSGTTPGGYQYSPAFIATSMGMNGMNNAFSWLSNKDNGGKSGGLVQVSFPSGDYSGGSSPAFSGSPSASDFTTKMYPYAQAASKKTGLPASFIIAQWGHETGWGSSNLSKNNLNFAGITTNGGNGFASYGSIDEFVNGYSSVINNSRYTGARNAASSGADAKTIADLLHQEGYATDPAYGSKVAGAVNTESKSMGLDISDKSLTKLATAIANAILVNGGGWTPKPYM